jgi:hypothetical protein
MKDIATVDGLGTFKHLDMYDIILAAKDDVENDESDLLKM